MITSYDYRQFSLQNRHLDKTNTLYKSQTFLAVFTGLKLLITGDLFKMDNQQKNLDTMDNFEKSLLEFSVAMTDQKYLTYTDENHTPI